jgi:pimeloyl-ACP methyl ester carboxylesterase
MKPFLLTAALMASTLSFSACTHLTASPDTAAMTVPAYDTAFPPALEELHFDSAGDRLNGLIYIAEGEGPHPSVVLLHGYPGNEKNLDLAQALRTDGFNVLFFHYRGAWGSEGDFSFTQVIEDVAAATDFLRTNADTYRADPDKITLIGHSMGGFAALEAGARDPRIQCTAGLAPANFGAVATAFNAMPELKTGFSAYSDTLQMLKGWSGEKALAELAANQEAFEVRSLAPKFAGRSVLIVGADKDTAVPADTIITPMIDAYEAQADVQTTGVILSGDHSFSWSRDALIHTVTDWANDCR